MVKITKEILVNWIDRPPSNSDLDLINYIISLDNFYQLFLIKFMKGDRKNVRYNDTNDVTTH